MSIMTNMPAIMGTTPICHHGMISYCNPFHISIGKNFCILFLLKFFLVPALTWHFNSSYVSVLDGHIDPFHELSANSLLEG